MKGYVLLICLFMTCTIAWTYQNLEYKGYERAQACYGECYEKYLEENGTVVEQLQAQAEEAASVPLEEFGRDAQRVTVQKAKAWEHSLNWPEEIANIYLKDYTHTRTEKR